MRGGAGVIEALLDPGRELPSYDPEWEARWEEADTLLNILRKRDPGGSSDLSRRLVDDLC